MTAICMIRCTEGILAAADGASYTPHGYVTGIGSKILLMPEHSTVITVQGPASLISLIRNRLGLAIDGFDDVLEDLADLLRELCDETEDRTGSRPFCNAYLGGWSAQRERWETYYIRSIPAEAEGHYSLPGEPWSVQPGPLVMAAPWPDDNLARRFGIIPKDLASLEFDAVRLATRLVAAARHVQASSDFGNAEGTYLVGGFIQTAWLLQDGGSTSIVHRWPDQAGERIDPARGEELPAWLRGHLIN